MSKQMKFTRRTYRKAIERAEDREYEAFCEAVTVEKSVDKWVKTVHLTILLKQRALREVGWV